MSVKKSIHILQPDNRPFVSYLESPEIKATFSVSRGESIPDRCDAVFCQTYTDPNMLQALLDTNKKIILHVNGDVWYELAHIAGDHGLLARVNIVCEKAAGIICLSKFLSKRGKKSVPKGNFFYLPRGLWGTRHTRIGVMPELYSLKKHFNTTYPLVLMQINLNHPLKYAGIPSFFEAIHRHMPRARFINVGNIEGNEALAEKWSHAYGLEFKTPATDWPQTLFQADIYVQASLFDTWGRSVADAMCCGLPVMAFNVGGIPTVSENIILCDPENQECMANAFEKLLEHPESWPTIGKKLYQEAYQLDAKHRYDYHDVVCCCLDEQISPHSNIMGQYPQKENYFDRS